MGTHFCKTCGKEVEIVKEIPIQNGSDRVLKCGHIGKARLVKEFHTRIDVLPDVKPGAPLKVETVPLAEGVVKLSGTTQPVFGSGVEIKQNAEGKITNIYVNNYAPTITAGTVNWSQSQSITITSIRDSYNSAVQEVHNSISDENERMQVLTLLNDIKNNIATRPPQETYSKLNQLSKYGKVLSIMLGVARQGLDLIMQGQTLVF